MKKVIWIISILLCCALVFTLVACGDKDGNQSGSSETNQSGTEQPAQQEELKEFTGVTFDNATFEYDGTEHAVQALGAPDDATVTYSSNKGTDVGTYTATVTISKEGYKPLTKTATLKVTVPSATSVVTARANASSNAQVGYDFHLNLSGTVTYAGTPVNANANYDGQYRYNSISGEMQFKRTTSGLLLYDANEYIMLEGSHKIKVTTNEKNAVKKVNVLADDGEELMLVNKPICELIDALKSADLADISLAAENPDYMFKANIHLTADNPLINKVLNIISKQGTSISMKNISFTNPVSGLVLYFNMPASKILNDFALSAEVAFPVNGVNVKLALNYSQVAKSGDITMPNVGGLIFDESAIQQELSTINAAVTALKNASSYSLDVEAKNQFDPGWNVTATTDRYTARMYKNTYNLDGNSFTAFNHSYEFKTHHEADGAETYKYTIGNIQDGSVHLISRKGSNTITELEGVTVDGQFDWLTEAFLYNASDVDCIYKKTSGNAVTYEIYLKNEATVAVNGKVSDMINSNEAEGVVAVNNYFDNSDYEVKESALTIELSGGVLNKISAETEIKYYPIGGEYSDKRITLTDTLELNVNKNLSDAKQYEAPKNTTTTLGKYGLNNSKFYIL